MKIWPRFLRDFHHGFTVSGEQPDRSFDMQLEVDTWRFRPVVTHVTVHVSRKSVPNTQYNLVVYYESVKRDLVCPCLSCPHCVEVRKPLILSLFLLVVVRERWLHTYCWCHIWTLVCTHQKHDKPPSKSLFVVPHPVTWNSIFTHDEAHGGLSRPWNTNIPELTSKNMWYQQVLIQLLYHETLLWRKDSLFSRCFKITYRKMFYFSKRYFKFSKQLQHVKKVRKMF